MTENIQRYSRGATNPFTVVTTTDTYSANYGDLVISEGGVVELPEPQQDEIIGVRNTGQYVELQSVSGLIQSEDKRAVSSRVGETVYLVSDGVNWYTISDQSLVTGAIPNLGDNQFWINEGSGSTLNDELTSETATISGPSWQSETGPVGDVYLEHEGAGSLWQTDNDILSTPLTVCGWVRFRDAEAFENTIATSDTTTSDDRFAVDADGDGFVLTAMDSGSDLRDVPFAGLGEWGFFALNVSETDHRIITFDSAQELADESDDSGVAFSEQQLTVGDANYDPSTVEFDSDFYVIKSASQLSKSEITELWEATKNGR